MYSINVYGDSSRSKMLLKFREGAKKYQIVVEIPTKCYFLTIENFKAVMINY